MIIENLHSRYKRFALLKELKAELRSLPHDLGQGYTWWIVYEDGQKYNTHMQSLGKGRFTKDLVLKLISKASGK